MRRHLVVLALRRCRATACPRHPRRRYLHRLVHGLVVGLGRFPCWLLRCSCSGCQLLARAALLLWPYGWRTGPRKPGASSIGHRTRVEVVVVVVVVVGRVLTYPT